MQVPVLEARLLDYRPARGVPTNREREVLALVAQGNSNKMVGEALGIQEHTVKQHVWNIMRKTGQRDRTASVMVALHRGWIAMVSVEEEYPWA